MERSQLRLVAPCVVIASSMMSGCASFGADRMPPDRFNYNQAIAESANEQMLLNLVRLRYSEIPVFLAVGSVLTQYIYTGAVGVEGSGGASLGEPLWSVGGSGAVRYVERPTITYIPLRGDEFADQLLEPIPIDMVFSLVDSGWRPDHLLFMTLYRLYERINIPYDDATDGELARRRGFREAVEQLIDLARNGAMEMQSRVGEDKIVTRYLVFEQSPDPETAKLIEQFKESVGLAANHNTFRITTNRLGRKPDEVTIRVRSLLELMGFLAQGIEIPPRHAEENRAPTLTRQPEEQGGVLPPMVVHAQVEPPETAFVAVQFHNHWYSIPHSDHQSKQAFSMLTYLFEMQAPDMQGAGPLLTVPAG